MSPDGSKAAFAADLSDQTQVTAFRFVVFSIAARETLYEYEDPLVQYRPTSWDRSSSRLLVDRSDWADTSASGVFVWDLRTGRMARAVPKIGIEAHGRWSPRGDEIVFEGNREAGDGTLEGFAIYAVRAEGGKPRTLARDARLGMSGCVRGGNASDYDVFFRRSHLGEQDGFSIWATRASGEKEWQVVPPDCGVDSRWSVSADGSRLALLQRDAAGSGTEVVVHPCTTGAQPERIRVSDYLWQPVWPPDGAAVLVGGRKGVWHCRIQPRALRMLPLPPADEECEVFAAWLPDCRRALIACGPTLALLDTQSGESTPLYDFSR